MWKWWSWSKLRIHQLEILRRYIFRFADIDSIKLHFSLHLWPVSVFHMPWVFLVTLAFYWQIESAFCFLLTCLHAYKLSLRSRCCSHSLVPKSWRNELLSLTAMFDYVLFPLCCLLRFVCVCVCVHLLALVVLVALLLLVKSPNMQRSLSLKHPSR